MKSVRGGEVKRAWDVCYGMLRAAACVDGVVCKKEEGPA